MRRIIYSTFVCLIFINSSLFSQASEQKLKEIFLDAEFFFMYQNYSEALYNYNTLYNNGYKENANINYRIGMCYLNISGQKQKAIAFLERASEKASKNYEEGSFKETKAPFEAMFYLGNAYRIDNQFDKAIGAYTKYKAFIGTENPLEGKYADVGIESSILAPEKMKKPEDVRITSLGRPICTSARDFFPAISSDEKSIIYNCSLKFYDAIYYSRKNGNVWETPVNINPDIQSDGDQYVSSLSFDEKTLFLRKEDNFDADIYYSNLKDGKWTKSKPLEKINTQSLERNATISKDGKTLYFSSNRSGSLGGLDIFKTNLLSNGNWGPIENLGTNVNTEFNEDWPVITEDGKRIYFVSQGHKTLGGYDIYYCELNADGSWGESVNLGYPVNTADDDNFYSSIFNGKVGYTSKYTSEGFGNEDIYRIEFPPYKPEITAPIPVVASVVDTTTAKQVAVVQPEVKKILQEVEKRPEAEITSVIVLHSLFFDFNSSNLNINATQELTKLAILLGESSDLKVILTGFHDYKGSGSYNLELSNRRATSAKTFLVKKGIKPSRITVDVSSVYIAKNENPDHSDCPEGRALNRRVDIRFATPVGENVKIEAPIVPDELKVILTK